MLTKKKYVYITDLKPGMISSTDINFEGTTLLGKGVTITDAIIDKLKKNYIVDKVEVYLENDSDETLIIQVKTVEELENTFNEFSSNLENIFDSLSTVKIPKTYEVRVFAQKVIDELNSVGTVIKNIMIYGSENDIIYRHSVNVAAMSFILGKWLGLTEKELSLLTCSAILHDFGKTEISMDLLNKEGHMTKEEYDTFKTHPVISYHFISEIPYIDPRVSKSILMHHERCDGSGYPLQIKDDMIPKFAKIIAIADVFDQAISKRCSQEIRGPLDVLQLIKDESLSKLNCNYCNMFLSHIVNYYMGENVILNDGRQCKVIQIELNDLTKPLLLDDNGFLDLKKEKDLYVERLVV